MAQYSEVKGSLFDATTDVIGQGCNMQGVMGAGIAKDFRELYPVMYQDYRAKCLAGEVELGGYDMYPVDDTPGWVANLYTQRLPGADASLAAVAQSVTKLCLDLQEKTGMHSLGLPRIGCGIGGLQWEDVQAVLQNIAKDNEVNIVVYTP